MPLGGPKPDLRYWVPVPLALGSVLSDEADTADSDLAFGQVAAEGVDDRAGRLDGGAVGQRDVRRPACLRGISWPSRSALRGVPNGVEHCVQGVGWMDAQRDGLRVKQHPPEADADRRNRREVQARLLDHLVNAGSRDAIPKADPEHSAVQPVRRREMQSRKAGQPLLSERSQRADLRLVLHQNVPVELRLPRPRFGTGSPAVRHLARHRAHIMLQS